MNKIITLSILALFGVTMAARAEERNECEQIGHTVGNQCTGGGSSTSSLAVIVDQSCVTTGVTCKYTICNNSCHSAPNGECPKPSVGTGTTTLAYECTDTPEWNRIVSANTDAESGTCTKQNGGKQTVYRCPNGYYTEALSSLDSTSEYSYMNITCKGCPQHPEDGGILIAGRIPSYVTTGGAGVKPIGACMVKANAEITDKNGHKFVFGTPCTYVE